jgi:hypothetical protein
VEIPIACVLPDMIQVTLNELIKKKEREQNLPNQVGVEANLSFWDKLKKVLGGTVKSVIGGIKEYLPKKYQFASEILEELINFVNDELTMPVYEKEETAKRRTEELRRKQQESLQKITDEETALKHVVTCFLSVTNTLEQRFPASNIKL